MANVDRTCKMRYCVNCGSDSTMPTDWWEDGPEHWQVILYCGNCEVSTQDRFHQLEVEDYDVWLDDCQDEIQRAIAVQSFDNDRDEIAEFARLLEHDVITPDDF